MNYDNMKNLPGKVQNNIVCVQSPGDNHWQCSSRLYISKESLIRHEASGLWLSEESVHK